MAQNIDTSLVTSNSPVMHGRRMILTTESEITPENVAFVISRAMEIHNINSGEINYLWNYRNGKQPILNRVKTGSFENIVNKIVENRAAEIIDFKIGYYVGEPIQYTSKKDDEKSLDDMKRLNDFFYAVNKASQDQDIVEWQMVCGTAYRIILPNENRAIKDIKPFEMFTLDARNTFVVRSVEMGNKVLMGVQYYSYNKESVVEKPSEIIEHFTCYTNDWIFTIENGILVDKQVNALGYIPIVEYPANNSRLGAFEVVLPLLDMLNMIDSDRMDGIEQTIQAFIKFINCEIDAKQFEQFKSMGAIMVKSVDGAPADVDTVTTNLDQNQTQTTKDDIYDAILEICGMPSRTGGASTSDTGAAVILRDGYALAESRAKVFENMFKRSEAEMLEIALYICNKTEGVESIELLPWDIETKFTRRNYENITSKSQVLCEMLNNPKIHPILAYQSCGLFPDPEYAYVISMQYYDELMAQYEPVEVDEDEESLRTDGQISGSDKESDSEGV